MSVYDNIKKLCDSQHIAITTLESQLGFGRGSIGKIRQAKNLPTANRLQAVADYFGVSIDYLLGNSPDAAAAGSPAAPAGNDAAVPALDSAQASGPDTAYEERLVDACRALNPEGKGKLLDYATDLAASGRYTAQDPNALAAYAASFEKETSDPTAKTA